MIREGQIVLFSFPQTDQERGKLRPALVLRALPGPHNDWLVCVISTQLYLHVSELDEVIHKSDPAFSETGLKTTSLVRITRLAVVSGDFLQGAIGSLAEARLKAILGRLGKWISGHSVES